MLCSYIASAEGVAGIMPMAATAVGAIRAVDTFLKLKGATGLVRDKRPSDSLTGIMLNSRQAAPFTLLLLTYLV